MIQPLAKEQEQPHALWEVLKQCSPTGPWVCGGAARRLFTHEYLTTDIDVFFKNEAQFNSFEQWLMANRASAGAVMVGSLSYRYFGRDVQCVASYFDSLGDVLSSFDFRMCMFGTDGESMHYTFDAASDVASKVLRLNKTKLPLYTLARIIKYGCEGYTVPENEAMPLLLNLAKTASLEVQEKRERGYGDLNPSLEDTF